MRMTILLVLISLFSIGLFAVVGDFAGESITGYAVNSEIEVQYEDDFAGQEIKADTPDEHPDSKMEAGVGLGSMIPETMQMMWMAFVIAAIIMIILELASASVFIYITKTSKMILLWVLLGNILTIPLVWYVIPALFWGVAGALVGTLIAVVVEAGIIAVLGKHDIDVKKSFELSVLMNMFSLFVGAAVLFVVFYGM
ncbi:hypothetical protein ACFL0V_07085 [Nanoarchaeota archaeon]